MLQSKIVHLKEIYKFYFDHLLIKRTFFVLIVKNVTKNQKINFPDKLCDICTKQMLKNKIVRFKKIYKFYFDHFLTKCTVFLLIVINTTKNQKFNFLAKLYGISKNVILQIKVVDFKKLYEFNIEHFLIGIIVFLINIKNAINSREFKFFKNYRNEYGKSSAKREYRDENVLFNVDRAVSKLITLLISNKKEFNHFFKSTEVLIFFCNKTRQFTSECKVL